jgi:hypothetical protein
MRESLSLRILALAVLLLTAAAVCVLALLATGVIHPRIAHLVAAGGAILIVAILAAAISALGPKFRPTPLLTPLFAGVFAALLATTAIYAVHAQITPKRSAVATVDIKPAAEPAAKVEPVKAAPLIEKASSEPDPVPDAAQPPPGFTPMFDTAMFAQSDKAQDQLPVEQAEDQQPAADQPETTAESPLLPEDEADNSAIGGPLVRVAAAATPPAKAEAIPAAAETEKEATVAVAKIPVPATAPDASAETAQPAADTPVNLAASFDPSGPVVQAADGPPMALDAVEAAPAHTAAIPPLPRIRPCGGDGPACP